ncbi:WD40 repeat-like protein [Backusella circina FSU 941]|nr:WD40 repeat-like protein [Backusella circina FSU 941]
MTIFDKISGLAQKAKDSVVSKTILSMDKRLEHSLSDNINTQSILMKKISTYGLPSNVSVVAFDSVAGLLAICISTAISLPNQASIKYLQFKTGFPLLVAIDNKNVIFTIDLRTQQVRHIIPAQEIITSVEYCTGSDWLFIGYANGYVDVLDIHLGKFTEYQIPNLLMDMQQQQQQQQQKRGSGDLVVALHLHPTDLDTLLIGYETGVYLWNIREKAVKRIFSLLRLEDPYRGGRLTCLSWSPNGNRFIAGYDDGCTHMWDIRNDNKPINSRKLLQTSFVPSTDAKATPTEPIYQMAWYTNENKSYIVVAGGIDPHDIQGLSVLEFDLESDAKESKKQTIMPLPVDLSHFLILGGSNPYSNLHNPFGIAVVGADHCLYVYSMDGMPLKLPPALEFLGPDVTNACHLPQLPDAAFRRLTAVTKGDRATRWLPITGGIAGPEHIYHIDSNDLLLTIHKGEVIKFWDASYTALRPLSHLTLRCLDDLGSRDNFLCCLDINKTNGAFSIGFVDGSVLVYEYISDPVDPTAPTNEHQQLSQAELSRNEKFINSCDDTLKEIGDLLNDMNEDDEHEEVENPTLTEPEQSSNTNPFLNTNNEENDNKKPATEPSPQQQQNPFETKQKTPSSPPSEAEIEQTPTKSIFTNLNKTGNSAGFYAALKITLNATITSVVSVGESILALASVDGVVTVVDIYKQIVLLSLNIASKYFLYIFIYTF